jgi:hypothetical protein
LRYQKKHVRMIGATTALCMTLAAAAFPVAANTASTPANAELAGLVTQDQADRAVGSNKIDWNVVSQHDAARRTQALRLLDAGSLRSAEDFFNAAVIFQHGDSISDTQLALALATTSARMDPTNRYAQMLMAQAWDRILVKSGKPQWYGTQFHRSPATGKWELYPTDPTAVTEAQRTAMGLPTMADTLAHLAQMNH